MNLLKLAIPLLLLNCANATNFGESAAENKRQSITVNATYETVFRSAVQVAVQLEWEVVSSDVNTGLIQVTTPGSLRAWADNVDILIQESANEITVTCISDLANEPNQRNVANYLEQLVASLN